MFKNVGLKYNNHLTITEISKKEDDSGEKGEKKEKGGVRRRKKANKDSKEDIDSPSEEEVT